MGGIWGTGVMQAAAAHLLAIDWGKIFSTGLKILLVLVLAFVVMRLGDTAIERFFINWNKIGPFET
ncbi:MAG: mechanosensitive ion channel protein MscS, partial [Desulfofundulus sp.]